MALTDISNTLGIICWNSICLELLILMPPGNPHRITWEQEVFFNNFLQRTHLLWLEPRAMNFSRLLQANMTQLEQATDLMHHKPLFRQCAFTRHKPNVCSDGIWVINGARHYILLDIWSCLCNINCSWFYSEGQIAVQPHSVFCSLICGHLELQLSCKNNLCVLEINWAWMCLFSEDKFLVSDRKANRFSVLEKEVLLVLCTRDSGERKGLVISGAISSENSIKTTASYSSLLSPSALDLSQTISLPSAWRNYSVNSNGTWSFDSFGLWWGEQSTRKDRKKLQYLGWRTQQL